MEKFSRAFFSMRMMATGMIVFLLAIATATFLESAYDIQTAKIIVYNAKWFEILLVYLGLNLIANIFKYNMFQRAKIAQLSFHLSFIVILIGAGVTRYISFEGLMLVREGEKSNFIYSSDPYVWFQINDGKLKYTFAEKHYMSDITNNYFDIDVEFPNHKTPITIEYVDFQKKMIDSLVINDSIKGVALEIITDGMKSNYLTKGGFLMAGEEAVSFEKSDAMPGIELSQVGAKIMIKSKKEFRYLPMAEMQKARQSGKEVSDSLFVHVAADTLVPFQTTTLYQVGAQQIVFKKVINHARLMLMPTGKRNVGSDYLTLKISDGTQSKIIQLKGGIGAIPEHTVFTLNGLVYEMEYGSSKIEIPFYIACRDFKLDRYPGSQAASSFESQVSILDEKNNYTRNQKIFMNNVMDYGGYRFFQSSYDPDEKGTRLSVNHDWWGTNITYLGYLLMAIGMIASLFAPIGRFRELNEKLRKSREKRELLMKSVLFVLGFGLIGGVNAQEQHTAGDGHNHNNVAAQTPRKPIFRVISEEHSDQLASLLVQDFQGRIIPMHTMCDQLLRKVHRGNKFEDYNAVQTIMSMHMYPDHWMDVKIIQVSSNLREKLKVTGEFASFKELADNSGQFKLMAEYDLAHQKLESKRDEYDKKLIKLVEKFQVVQSIFSWQYMKIMPVATDKNNTWFVPLSMELMQIDSISSGLALRYISKLDRAAEFNKYDEVNNLLVDLKKFQREEGANVVPSETKVNMEISYNKMSIFKNSSMMYLSFGFILLIIFFIRIFIKPSPTTSKIFKRIGQVITGLMIVVFVYHGVGLGFRWYISGHAPWSNGYEAVIFIAWVTMIAGFAFSRKNPVIIAGTAILAAMMIFVTEMNLLDPEITPLQPVLKSYWLMIHVAIITGSYGFLGLGAILGLVNLKLYIFRTQKNGKIVTLNINELTYVSEMTITIGLFMLTIGTFLGGIWANESWGRYWGWDPKETWALVSVLVYAVILHLRYIPALKGKFVFNLVSLWGYSAILFTFFGVNFYLVGLHSYAQGEGLGRIPPGIIATVVIFVLFTVFAAIRNKQYTNKVKELEL
jgi:cytochrome c-type biogenesis protein CcsB